MGFGNLGFFLHAEDLHVLVEFDHTCALEFLDGELFVAHDAGGLFGFCEIDEFAEAEEEKVVCGDDQYVVIDAQLVHCKEEVADCAKAGLVGLRSIINDGNWLFYF